MKKILYTPGKVKMCHDGDIEEGGWCRTGACRVWFIMASPIPRLPPLTKV